MAVPNSYGQPPDNEADDSQDQSAGDQETNASDSDTVLVDKSVFGDEMPQPGDKVTFTFVKAYEDEAELKLADDSDVGEDSGTPESADRALGAMAA